MRYITVKEYNECYSLLEGDPETILSIYNRFSFRPKNYRFHPAYKTGQWDGFIHLVKIKYSKGGRPKALIPKGSIFRLIKLSRELGFECNFRDVIVHRDECDIDEYLEWLKLPFQPRDYQYEILKDSFKIPRRIFLSPTASGKSFVQYLIARRFDHTLLIVPSLMLLNQMYSNFLEFSENNPISIKRLSGKNKEVDIFKKPDEPEIVIATYQTLSSLSQTFFDRFDCIIGDECHKFEAKTLTSIMNKSCNVHYRYGLTGTIEDASFIHEFSLEALFGPVKKVVSTVDLIKEGYISNLDIEAVLLKYDKDKWNVKNGKKGWTDDKSEKYRNELEFLVESKDRNAILKEDIENMDGVVLVLSKFIEHCKYLYEIIDCENKFLILGEIDSDERERIRKMVMDSDKALIVATYGTMSTGVDIPNISHIVFATPIKSKITTIQSIGRGLRLHENKDKLIVHDYGDVKLKKDGKPGDNYSYRHFQRRMELYREEGFNVKVKERNV